MTSNLEKFIEAFRSYELSNFSKNVAALLQVSQNISLKLNSQITQS